MKKLIVLLIIGLLYSACSKYETSETSSGGNISLPANTNSTAGINFRVSQDAILHAQSLALLQDLKSFEEEKVPANWPRADLAKVKAAFLFLHKQETNRTILKVTTSSQSGNTLLSFTFDSNEEFNIQTDRKLESLQWTNEEGDRVSMSRVDKEWRLDVEAETMNWSVLMDRLCWSLECRDI